MLELHLGINGAAGTVEVWLDNARIADLSNVGTVNLGTAPVGQFQIGDAQTARTYDVVFDDAAFGSARLGPVADGAAPSVPAGVSAVATSPFSVDVTWSPSTDDVAGDRLRRVARRCGDRVGRWLDDDVHRWFHAAVDGIRYTVRARDASNNVSAPSAAAPVTTPAGATPVFADGFESGNFVGVDEQRRPRRSRAPMCAPVGSRPRATRRTGTRSPARPWVPRIADAYARVGFELKSQVSQVNLLRMRDAAGVSIGYLYVSTGGKLAFHNDTLNTNTVSATSVGVGLARARVASRDQRHGGHGRGVARQRSDCRPVERRNRQRRYGGGGPVPDR